MAADEGYELQGSSVCVCGTCIGRKEGTKKERKKERKTHKFLIPRNTNSQKRHIEISSERRASPAQEWKIEWAVSED